MIGHGSKLKEEAVNMDLERVFYAISNFDF